MPEGRLKREYVHAPLHSVCGMAVPQLVWVDVESGGSSPLPANISNCLAREMSFTAGTRDDEIFRIAAAQLSLPFIVIRAAAITPGIKAKGSIDDVDDPATSSPKASSWQRQNC